MTPENAKKLLPIITAYAEGKTIQFNEVPIGVPNWVDSDNLDFCEDPELYRIKPEPVLMTVDDLPPTVWLLDPDGDWALVFTIYADGDLKTYSRTRNIPWLHEHGFKWSPARKNPQSFLKAWNHISEKPH